MYEQVTTEETQMYTQRAENAMANDLALLPRQCVKVALAMYKISAGGLSHNLEDVKNAQDILKKLKRLLEPKGDFTEWLEVIRAWEGVSYGVEGHIRSVYTIS